MLNFKKLMHFIIFYFISTEEAYHLLKYSSKIERFPSRSGGKIATQTESQLLFLEIFYLGGIIF
ncbi:MAG: hypothetical protein ACTSP8_07330 [Promethearchaeota archaeon]